MGLKVVLKFSLKMGFCLSTEEYIPNDSYSKNRNKTKKKEEPENSDRIINLCEVEIIKLKLTISKETLVNRIKKLDENLIVLEENILKNVKMIDKEEAKYQLLVLMMVKTNMKKICF